MNCIFLLGPALAIDTNGRSLPSGLINYFKDNELEIEEDMDNLFRCRKPVKSRAYGYLKEYYRINATPNDMHRQLAQIPCHLYVSINSDLLMKQALEDYGVEHEFNYYIKGQPSAEVAKPTQEKPLLYNLFGSIDNQQSLIFTHDDLIQYMLSIIKEFKLPQNLRGTLENSLYFIFLGFDFEKWYLRLLLKMFLDETKLSIASEAGSGTQGKLRTFYAGNYGLEFVDYDIEKYIRNIYDECARRGVLRPIREKTQISIQEEIRELIRKDEIGEALDRLYQFLEKLDEQVFKDKAEDRQDLLNEIDSHTAQLSRSEKSLRKHEILEEVVRIEKNKIINAINEISQRFAP
jgi:hypothetical protein